MAERLEQHQRATSPQERYDWQKWQDGSVWKIRRGEDYESEFLRNYFYHRAKENNLTVWTETFEDDQGEGIIFQFAPKDESVPRREIKGHH